MANAGRPKSFVKKGEESKGNLVHFFKTVDRGSSMPSWYYTAQMEEEQDWIRRAESQLEENLIPAENVRDIKMQLRARKQKYEQIREAWDECKKLVNGDKDRYKARLDELKETIADSLFTRDQMFHKPTRQIDPRWEADRIPVRNHMIKEAKIIARLLGEEYSTEQLRKTK